MGLCVRLFEVGGLCVGGGGLSFLTSAPGTREDPAEVAHGSKLQQDNVRG